ncbi:hypothetical protein SeMB42_g02354 [Synchytrium endobioticum]|uniref:ADP,ATP carrier protein n=1 Tax=Synchytrium endobioticum TaxID=286115 RepID=A0A507CZX8_9FUNG|nr:hypothetical protein SeLEV6574_g04329 [Synchytrium endobioticum]TPX50150.1 hypothetical protein SeMB42_g02354 [Synchytrium endobioticum]
MPENIKLTPFGDAVAGSSGAVLALLLVYPLDSIKTRLQVQSRHLAQVQDDKHTYLNAVDAFIKILRHEGLLGFYSGLLSGMFGTVAQSFAYFYCYSLIRAEHNERSKKAEIGVVTELTIGALAGAFSQIFTLPIGVVNTRLQTAVGEEKGMGFIGTWRNIVREEGVAGLWRGFAPSMILCVNPAITYGSFERLKAAVNHRAGRPTEGRLSAVETFVVGAIAKTLATFVTYPYIMAKVKLQWKPPKTAVDKMSDADKDRLHYKNSVDVLAKVLESDGVLGLYQGMNAQIYKAVLSQAFLFVFRDHFTLWTFRFFQYLSNLRARKSVVRAA